MERVPQATFEELVGTQFRIETVEGDPFVLELSSVRDLGEREVDGGSFDCYALEFRGPGQLLLPQRMYRLNHDDLGDLDIFLVPIGPDGNDGLLYEAVFN